MKLITLFLLQKIDFRFGRLKMSAILHCIVTEIENARVKDHIKHWRWMSNIYHNTQDVLWQIEEDGFMCDSCESPIYTDTYIPRGKRICDMCLYEPYWEDAFHKFGHEDGGATYTITESIVDAIEDLGYDCCGNEETEHYDEKHDWTQGWGLHNHSVITKIVKSDTGEVVYPIEGFAVGGYDDRHFSEVLPTEIFEAIVDIEVEHD